MVTFLRIISTALVFLLAWMFTTIAAGPIAGEVPWLKNALLAAGNLAGLYGAWRVFSNPMWSDSSFWRNR